MENTTEKIKEALEELRNKYIKDFAQELLDTIKLNADGETLTLRSINNIIELVVECASRKPIKF